MGRRAIPFGYRYDNGQIAIDIQNADIIKEIFDQYIGGKSMIEISALLNKLHIEYSPGVIGWNKARIKRILEDNRYLGDETYPQIISLYKAEKANEIKENRNNQKDTNKDNLIYRLNVTVICPCCNSIMKRRHEPRLKIHERWKCQNTVCRKIIPIPDSLFLSKIHVCLDNLINNPDLIRQIEADNQISIETYRAENEISRMLESGNSNKNGLKAKIIEAISTKYDNLNSQIYEAQRLRDLYRNQHPTKNFPIELFNRTINAISFDSDNNVIITLINGQAIRRENTNGTAEEKSDSHRADDYRQ